MTRYVVTVEVCEERTLFGICALCGTRPVGRIADACPTLRQTLSLADRLSVLGVSAEHFLDVVYDAVARDGCPAEWL